MIDVLVVPTLNQSERLYRLLASIDAPVGDLVIVDNGCRWPRGDRLKVPVVPVVARQHVIELPGNLGVAGAWNLAIKVTPHASRWLICNDDTVFGPGSITSLDQQARRDAVTLSNAEPAWSCFVIGDGVVDRVGLFDERFHPAYFEDTDYARRCALAGVDVVRTAVPIGHDNSSTLASGVGRGDTYMDNLDWNVRKEQTGDTSWGWDLSRRRDLGWEPHAR